tara:strand:+ start:2980 stop:3723 length:744 start_codon:yes stop_codon:yes gene_type:complete
MSAFDPSVSDTTTTQEPTLPEQSQAGVLETLVGEGKKFSNNEDLAKGKAESDSFIEQLQTELQGLRGELDKRMTSEDVLAKIREENAKSSAAEGNTTPSLGKDDVAELVKQTLESTRTEETMNLNLGKVDQELLNKFGEKAGEWLASKSQELGVSVDFLADVAKTSPSAFFNTVGLNTETNTNASVTQSSVNTESLAHNNQATAIKAGTKRSYDELRKSDPRKYWSPEVQNDLFKSRQELGAEAFYA